MNVVLLLQAGEDGPVKIISTTDKLMRRHLEKWQISCPSILHVRAMLDGDERLERRLHVTFEARYIERDWYGPEILAEVPGDVQRIGDVDLDDDEQRRIDALMLDELAHRPS